MPRHGGVEKHAVLKALWYIHMSKHANGSLCAERLLQDEIGVLVRSQIMNGFALQTEDLDILPEVYFWIIQVGDLDLLYAFEWLLWQEYG